MNIRVPMWVVRSGEAFYRWGDVLLWKVGPLNVRRIDILLALSAVICVAWYGYTTGWMGALTGGMLWLFLMLCVLFFF